MKLPSLWRGSCNGVFLTGRGASRLLDEPLTAFFSSRQCPGAAIHAATEWALEQAKGRLTVVSGFHSPLEQSVLQVLLQSHGGAVVVVLARPIVGARLPTSWLQMLAEDRMAVVSVLTSAGRLTEARAAERNVLVSRLAGKIVVAHTSPGGDLRKMCEQWQASGQTVTWLA